MGPVPSKLLKLVDIANTDYIKTWTTKHFLQATQLSSENPQMNITANLVGN